MKPKTVVKLSLGVGLCVGGTALAVRLRAKRKRASGTRAPVTPLRPTERNLAGDAVTSADALGADWGEFAEALQRSAWDVPVDRTVLATIGANGVFADSEGAFLQPSNPQVAPWGEPGFRPARVRSVDDEFRPVESRPIDLVEGLHSPSFPSLPSVGFGTGSTDAIPDPWPVGTRVPPLPVKSRRYRLAKTREAVVAKLREEQAWGRFMTKISHDAQSGGRAKVHIANDPIGLHDELSRSGRLRSGETQIVDGPALARGDLSSLRSSSDSSSRLSRARSGLSRFVRVRVLGGKDRL